MSDGTKEYELFNVPYNELHDIFEKSVHMRDDRLASACERDSCPLKAMLAKKELSMTIEGAPMGFTGERCWNLFYRCVVGGRLKLLTDTPKKCGAISCLMSAFHIDLSFLGTLRDYNSLKDGLGLRYLYALLCVDKELYNEKKPLYKVRCPRVDALFFSVFEMYNPHFLLRGEHELMLGISNLFGGIFVSGATFSVLRFLSQPDDLWIPGNFACGPGLIDKLLSSNTEAPRPVVFDSMSDMQRYEATDGKEPTNEEIRSRTVPRVIFGTDEKDIPSLGKNPVLSSLLSSLRPASSYSCIPTTGADTGTSSWSGGAMPSSGSWAGASDSFGWLRGTNNGTVVGSASSTKEWLEESFYETKSPLSSFGAKMKIVVPSEWLRVLYSLPPHYQCYTCRSGIYLTPRCYLFITGQETDVRPGLLSVTHHQHEKRVGARPVVPGVDISKMFTRKGTSLSLGPLTGELFPLQRHPVLFAFWSKRLSSSFFSEGVESTKKLFLPSHRLLFVVRGAKRGKHGTVRVLLDEGRNLSVLDEQLCATRAEILNQSAVRLENIIGVVSDGRYTIKPPESALVLNGPYVSVAIEIDCLEGEKWHITFLPASDLPSVLSEEDEGLLFGPIGDV